MFRRLRAASVLVLTMTLLIPGTVASVTIPTSISLNASVAQSAVLVSQRFYSKKWLKDHGFLKRTTTKYRRSTSVSPQMFECGLDDCYEIRNIREDGLPWYKISGHSVFGEDGETIGLNFTAGVANGFSSKVGVSGVFVSAEVGFNVTLSWSATVSGSKTVPAGKCMRMDSYKVYQDWKGDVYKKFPTDDHWTNAGWIRFWEFAGIGFRTFEVPCS